jgi:phospholipid/cholesterol/gamma-HCH transport system permease protein
MTRMSFLVGLILAFMGTVQQRQFGAQRYVATLVGLGMTRKMGAMMTGVIIAGRTGAAFAAPRGTLQVNEKIDALIRGEDAHVRRARARRRRTCGRSRAS